MNEYKTIEVRGWTTPYRGYIALHASKIFDAEGFDFLKGIIRIPCKDEYPKGVLVGYAYLYEVKEFNDKDIFVLFKDRHLNNPDWWTPNKYGFVLQDITSIPHVVSKGKLGLYRLKKPLIVENF